MTRLQLSKMTHFVQGFADSFSQHIYLLETSGFGWCLSICDQKNIMKCSLEHGRQPLCLAILIVTWFIPRETCLRGQYSQFGSDLYRHDNHLQVHGI